MVILPFFAFLAGIVTILSPCILPVLPIVLSGSIGGRRRPLGIITGFTGSFALFTLLLSSLVQWLGIPPDSLRIAAVLIMVLFGSVLVFPLIQQKFEILVSGFIKTGKTRTNTGFSGGLLVGAGLGVVWTPCVGPIIASVITLAVSRQIDGGAVVIILAYAAGTAIPMLALMTGGRKLISRFPKLSANTERIQRGFGVVMIAAALSIGFGLDRKFQQAVLEIFPRYGSGLTALEQTESVQKALQDRKGEETGEKGLDPRNPPEKGQLGDFGPAPPILTEGQWFNSSPLTMEELKGKVVLIDFWTYSCVNCVRTLPYLKSWYESYKDQGLVILGVHSPEFAFERDPENLQRAIEDLGVTWPVVQDNSFAQWSAYNNLFWPAHFFIDARGNIRYFQFGEGEYQTAEQVIRMLLIESGQTLTLKSAGKEWEGISSSTPETYLGYGRRTGFLTEDSNGPEQREFSLSREPENGEWGLEGVWSIQRNSIESSGTGNLTLGFEAKDVFLVIEPVSKDGKITVYLDGVKQKTIEIDESRMYQLVDMGSPGDHILKLEIEGTMRFYAFTFG